MTTVQEQRNSIVLLAYDIYALSKVAFNEISESIASNSFGQRLFQIIDHTIRTVEKTAQWALPDNNEKTESHTTNTILIRPLPWILFIPLILTLRFIYEGVSFAAFIFGNGPIKKPKVIHFIQSKRRALRAIKYQGLRNIRSKAETYSWDFTGWIPNYIKKFTEKIVDKILDLFKFQSVIYKNMNDVFRISKKNTIAPAHATKRPREHSIDDINKSHELDDLISDTEILHNSDSDPDYNPKNISQASDTSRTSSDEDEQDKPKEPEVNQNGPDLNKPTIIQHNAEVHTPSIKTSSSDPAITVAGSSAVSKDQIILNGSVNNAVNPNTIHEVFVANESANFSPIKVDNVDKKKYENQSFIGIEKSDVKSASVNIINNASDEKNTSTNKKEDILSFLDLEKNNHVSAIEAGITAKKDENQPSPDTEKVKDKSASPIKIVNTDKNTIASKTEENHSLIDINKPATNSDNVSVPLTPQNDAKIPVIDAIPTIQASTPISASVENKSPPRNPNVENNSIQNNGTPPKIADRSQQNTGNSPKHESRKNSPKKSSPTKGKHFGEDNHEIGHHDRPLINLINHIKEHHG